MNLLIPYVPLVNHQDPDFSEYTYADSAARARKLKQSLKAGDYIFFHTSRRNIKYITAYYVVEYVIDTAIASKDKNITRKYKNPHITECLAGVRCQNGEDDAIVFGNPITSLILKKPLVFNRELADKLSLNINFDNNFTESQVIGSATRAWRQLTFKDVDTLLNAIDSTDNSVSAMQKSTEEVGQILEKDIENHLAHDPSVLGNGLKYVGRQLQVPSGRIDLLLENDEGSRFVVEIKLGRIGRDAVSQIRGYISDLRKEHPTVKGIIVCEGVLPAYEEDFRNLNNIQIFTYGWLLGVQKWS